MPHSSGRYGPLEIFIFDCCRQHGLISCVSLRDLLWFRSPHASIHNTRSSMITVLLLLLFVSVRSISHPWPPCSLYLCLPRYDQETVYENRTCTHLRVCMCFWSINFNYDKLISISPLLMVFPAKYVLHHIILILLLTTATRYTYTMHTHRSIYQRGSDELNWARCARAMAPISEKVFD